MDRRSLIDVLPWLLSIRAALTVIDPVAVVVAGILVLGTHSPWALAGGAAAAFLVGRSADLHRSRLVLYVLEDMPKLALAAAIATLAMVGLDQRQGDTAAHAAEAATCLLVSFCLLVLLRTAVYALTHTLRRRGLVAHPVIIVGAGAVGRELASALLARREHGLVPVGMIDCDDELTSRALPGAPAGRHRRPRPGDGGPQRQRRDLRLPRTTRPGDHRRRTTERARRPPGVRGPALLRADGPGPPPAHRGDPRDRRDAAAALGLARLPRAVQADARRDALGCRPGRGDADARGDRARRTPGDRAGRDLPADPGRQGRASRSRC